MDSLPSLDNAMKLNYTWKYFNIERFENDTDVARKLQLQPTHIENDKQLVCSLPQA